MSHITDGELDLVEQSWVSRAVTNSDIEQRSAWAPDLGDVEVLNDRRSQHSH
jgi:hypothetical protein